MNEQEYTEQLERVTEYGKLDSEIKRLENEKIRIDYGILSIKCNYCFGIDCCERYDGFKDNLKNALTQLYDDEIERLKKLRDKI